MRKGTTDSRSFAVLSWAVLGGSLLTVAFLLAAIGWVFSRSVLTTDIPMPEYRGLSLPVCYCRVLYAGFVNLTWVIAVAGVVLVWLLAVRRGQASKRLALGISLILLHRWLQLTLVFLLMFGRFKT